VKPLKLSIQAFGPFAGLQEIDFSLLGQSPLFLINGPTGAGKSSILDAICFALYGKTTADERDASEMRCDQADANTLTEITLDFELAGKQYRVKRSPQQDRPKARGDGFTRHNGEATLWSIDKQGELTLMVARKVKDTNQQIETITGLNVEQFRQVMVLPQGKFRDLLLADSAQREKIFGQLFQTHIYRRIEDQLKQQASVIVHDIRDLENQIKGILQSAELNTENEIEQQFEILKPELKKSLKLKQHANASFQNVLLEKQSSQDIVEKFAELESSKKKLSDLQLQQAGITSKQKVVDAANKAQKIKAQFDELNRQKDQLNKIQQQMIESVQLRDDADREFIFSQKELVKAKKSFEEVDSLKAERQQIESYVNKINQLDSAKKIATESALKESKSSSEFISIQNDVTSVTNKIVSQEKQLGNLHQETSGLGNKQIELVSLQQQSNQREKLAKLQDKIVSGSKQLIQTESEFERLTGIADKSLRQAKQQEMFLHSGQAMNLAKELKQNQPCPVCGSTSHPSPALPDNNQFVISKDQVEQARLQADSDKDKQQKILNQLNELKIKQEQLEKEITELSNQPGMSSELTDHDFNERFESLKLEVQMLVEKQASISTFNETLSGHKLTLQSLNNSLSQIQQLHEKEKQQLLIDQQAVKHLSSDIPEQYQLKTSVVEALERLSTSVKKLTENFEKANSANQQCLTRLTELKTTVEDKNRLSISLRSELEISASDWEQVISNSIFDTEQHFCNALLTEVEQTAISQQITIFIDLLNDLKSIIKLQTKELKDKVEPDMTVVNLAVEESEKNFKIIEQQWLKVDSRVKQLKSVTKKLKQAHTTNKELESRYAIYGVLSDVANGRTSNKISLQRFVLSVLLDDVLIQASQRLSLMSKGRYQLLRRQTSSDNRKVSGLELDIEDAYTGKSRSVSTLSGGESFMAALSLALGLSDVVQAYAGGIKLDTLFIDEGFGSLDQESLDLAIRTLVDLQATGRMIGIISHVTELKEQMALRLDVISSKTGSHVNIITA